MYVFIKNINIGTCQRICSRSFFRYSVINQQKVLQANSQIQYVNRTDTEWVQAKRFDEIPGPTSFQMIRNFLPGGTTYGKNMVEMNEINREQWGDFFKINSLFGKPNFVLTYNPKDFEVVYRNEGIWPIRQGMDSFTYYRTVKRPDVYRVGGLLSEQGKEWSEIRNKVNPIIMKGNMARENLSEIDKISIEFLQKLDTLRDPQTNVLKVTLAKELEMWALESIAYIALNARLGLISEKPDERALKLSENVNIFFDKSFTYDAALPHFWKYYETAGFKELLQAFDHITEITLSYIDQAIKKIELEKNHEAKSVLEKLLRIDKNVAMVMAIDMLMAGIDTTSSTFVTILYHIAKHQDKQDLLRKEVKTILPDVDTPLTEENTRNMPYLRACMKEGLRITHITPGNARTTTKDLVLSGYQVPKNTIIVMMAMALANSDTYFPKSKEYMPERWLKSGELACPAAKMTNPFAYLPFGFGPRTCVGKRIAEMEIESLLARIIRNYRVTWAGESDLKYRCNLILLPVEDKFAFEPLDK